MAKNNAKCSGSTLKKYIGHPIKGSWKNESAKKTTKRAKIVLARQPSREADPLLGSSRGGGGTPLCIGKQEVGTYI
jgi:hypothetical protein